MELNQSYDTALYTNLEASIVETYRNGIRRLRESQDTQEQVEILKEMFKSLGESHFGSDAITWAADAIFMYRTLGNIYTKVLAKHSLISEITSEYGGVESVRNALEELQEIKKTLKKFGLDSLGGDGEVLTLEERLKLVERIEEIASEYSCLLDKETDIESINSALEKLKVINRVLKEHKINPEDLDRRLSVASELETKINALGRL